MCGKSIEGASPKVSIIIPCLNEEKFIGMCLGSILANDYPKDGVEVLVVDGMSEDRTRAIVKEYSRTHPSISLLDNPRRLIGAAMNIGIRNACGDVIIKMDAHSTYPKEYVSKCVKYLYEYRADNVGGISDIVPSRETTIAKAIAHVLAHPFGSGNAYVKIGSKEPRWADTVAFGCYRKELLQKLGLYNEEIAGEDMDLNTRLRKSGGKILLVPEIVIKYYADPDLKSFWWHNFADGVWATYVLKFRRQAFSWRHWVPMACVSSLIGSGVLSTFFPPVWWLLLSFAGLYALVSLAVSAAVAARERHVQYLWTMPIVFASRHFPHGCGALMGLILVLLPGVRWRGRRGTKV